jgi:hypothetical protein
MSIVWFDMETFYRSRKDKKGDSFSLRGLTTEAYINDSWFQTIGFAYAIDSGPATWVTGTDDEIEAALHGLEMHNHVVAAHNAPFDAMILSQRYGIFPRIIIDTLSMAAVAGLRGSAGGSLAKLAAAFNVGVKGEEIIAADGLRREHFPPDQLAKYGEYCCNDVELLREIFMKLRPAVPPDEMRVIDMTCKMFTQPIFHLDLPLLEARLKKVRQDKFEALNALVTELNVGSADDVGVILRSAEKFAELLQGYGIEPGMKPSPSDPNKQTYAFAKTDKFMAELLEHSDPRVVTLAETRLGERSNIEENRLQRFIDTGNRAGALPISLTVSGAHTHRYSGGGDKLNVQNLPKRGGADMTLRNAMRAPPGYTVVAADSSQIEVRILAYMANHAALLNIFIQGRDPYSEFAATIYGGEAGDILKQAKAGIEPFKTQRAVAKESVLSCGYMVGAVKFRERLRQFGVVITEDEANNVVDGYRSYNTAITQFWNRCKTALMCMVIRGSMQFGGPANTLFTVGAEAMPGRTDVSPYIELPNQTRIYYHGLTQHQGPKGPEYVYYQGNLPSRLYSGKLAENLAQALAFAVLKWQALQLLDCGVPVHLNVHDEWVSVVPNDRAEQAQRTYEKVMALPPPWCADLPLACEVGMGDTYGSV